MNETAVKYLIEGRIIPERVDLNCPQIDFGKIKFEIAKSKIFILFEDDSGLPIPDIRNSYFPLSGTS